MVNSSKSGRTTTTITTTVTRTYARPCLLPPGTNVELTPPRSVSVPLEEARRRADLALRAAADELEVARKRLAEWGFVSASQPMILKDYTWFAQGFGAAEDFPKTKDYIRAAGRQTQGSVTEVVQIITALNGRANVETRSGTPAVNISTPISPDALGTNRANMTVNIDVTNTNGPQKTTFTNSPSAIEDTDTLSAQLNGISSRQAVQQGMNDKIAELLLRFMMQPKEESLINAERTRLLLGVMQVSCSPGWRTRKNYIGDLNISFDYIARVPAEDGSFRNVPSEMWSRPTQPDVLAVMPLIDSQTLDLGNNQRNVLALAMLLTATVPGTAASGNGGLQSNFLRDFQRNVQTRTAVPVINTFTTTTSAGFRFSPSLVALDDPAKARSDTANVLLPTTFPAIVVLAVNTDDLNNSFKFPYAGGNHGQIFHIGKGTGVSKYGCKPKKLEWENIFVAASINSRWMLKESGFFPRKQDIEAQRYNVAKALDNATQKLQEAQQYIGGDLIDRNELEMFFTRLTSIQRTTFDLRNRVLGTVNYQPLGEQEDFRRKVREKQVVVPPPVVDSMTPEEFVGKGAGTIVLSGVGFRQLKQAQLKFQKKTKGEAPEPGMAPVPVTIAADTIAYAKVRFEGSPGEFLAPGKYLVTLLDDSGEEVSSPKDIEVTPPPAPPKPTTPTVGPNDLIIHVQKGTTGKIDGVTVRQGANVNLSAESLNGFITNATKAATAPDPKGASAPAVVPGTEAPPGSSKQNDSSTPRSQTEPPSSNGGKVTQVSSLDNSDEYVSPDPMPALYGPEEPGRSWRQRLGPSVP